MNRRSPAQLLAEARDYWSDDVSFSAALALAVREVEPWGDWSDLHEHEQRAAAETLLHRAIGRERSQRIAA